MSSHLARPAPARRAGFTLLELIAAIAVVGLLLAVSVPGAARFYESMQYRQALRNVLDTLLNARQRAADLGRAQDVAFDPARLQVTFEGETQQLPAGFQLAVTAAAEVNRRDVGVIRFYPRGDSTGGDIDIRTPTGRGVTITVDWLTGRVNQRAHAAD